MTNKPLSYLECIKAVTSLAVANGLSVENALQVYNEFNDKIYNNHIHRGGGVKSDNSDLENKAFQLTQRYFKFKKNQLETFNKN